jgi:hypothetical protein
VSLFVSDTNVNKIHIFRDEKALNPEANLGVTYEMSLGQTGFGYGNIYYPLGLAVVPSLSTGNTDSLDFADIYVVSSSSKGTGFTKYSKSFNAAPIIQFTEYDFLDKFNFF